MKNIYRTLSILLLCLFSLNALAQVPVLSSYPSSPNVIFLDFDGHVVNGTSWNYGGPIVCDAATLSTEQMTAVFNRVAEDYRPFTVNVTTDSTKYMAAPADRRMRIVLTPTSSWYGAAGGVAFVNSFSWGDNTPCFVFTALLNNNTKNIAEAASHEAGHTLGLRHQSSYDAVCNKTSEYNPGKGSGEIGWAPIMGVGYYQNMTLWNYGANPYGCTNLQDDLSIITSGYNGISFRTDDFTSVLANANAVNFTGNTLTVPGIIERPNDVDVMKFTVTTAGTFHLDATPFSLGAANVGSNIDLEIELVNSIQSVIKTSNDSMTLSTSFDINLDSGTYYLVVKGKGNVFAPNYASLGSYTLKGIFTPGNALPLRKLQLKGSADKEQHKLDWEIIADEQIVAQTLELSVNGTNFQTLTSFSSGSRTYHYAPATKSLQYYRLKVRFDNGREHYSNIIALRSGSANTKPNLIGNVSTGVMMVNSPSAFTYNITDVTGRVFAKGNLVQGVNTLSPNLPVNGMYIIRYQNDAEVYTEKFIRQ